MVIGCERSYLMIGVKQIRNTEGYKYVRVFLTDDGKDEKEIFSKLRSIKFSTVDNTRKKKKKKQQGNFKHSGKWK